MAVGDTKLQARLQRGIDVGIRMNKSKIKLRQKSLTFLGSSDHGHRIEARSRDGQGY